MTTPNRLLKEADQVVTRLFALKPVMRTWLIGELARDTGTERSDIELVVSVTP